MRLEIQMMQVIIVSWKYDNRAREANYFKNSDFYIEDESKLPLDFLGLELI